MTVGTLAEAQAIAKQLVIDFNQTKDGNVDAWNVPPESGPFDGDCEEFALGALIRVEGGEAEMWKALEQDVANLLYVEVEEYNSGHAVLHHRDFGYIDSLEPYWRPSLNGKKYKFSGRYAFSVNDIKRRLAGEPKKSNKMVMLAAVGVFVGVLVFLATQGGVG